jgi:hypothetical protein
VLPETVQLSEAVSLIHTILHHLDVTVCPQPFQDALFWALFYAGFLARDDQRQDFVKNIKKIAGRLELRSFSQIEKILSLFLYRETVFQRVFLDLWEEVVACN